MGSGALLRNALVAIAATWFVSPAMADGVAESVAEVRTCLKQGQTDKALETLKGLADIEDARVKDLLLDLTGNASDAVAIAAYGHAAKQKNPSLLGKLRSRAESDDLAKDRPAVYGAVLEAMESYGRLHGLDKLSRDVLAGVIQKNLPVNSEFCVRAIRAYATFQDKDAFERLLRWLGQCEPTAGVGNTFPLSRESRLCYEKAHTEIRVQLTALTGGVTLNDAKSWIEWSKKNKHFKFPK